MKRLFVTFLALLSTFIAGTLYAQPPGYSMSNAIEIGVYNSSFAFSDSRNSATGGFTNNYGNAANDVWYKFSIYNSTASLVQVSLCGSNFDTYLRVLNGSGQQIATNDDDQTTNCPGIQSYLELSNLTAGTYYIIAEGYSNYSGTIFLSVNATIASGMNVTYPPPPTFTTGVTISALSPTVSGGVPSSAGQTTVTLAGTGTSGFNNGFSTQAAFDTPIGTVIDASGNVYVADSENEVIRKITPDGNVTTLAGQLNVKGAQDGTSATFNHPAAVAVDAAGNVYVADQVNHKIRKILPNGNVTTLAGSGTAGYQNGTGTAAQFNNPTGLCLDGSGNVYVADYANHRIRKITPSGVVSLYAGSGTAGSLDNTNGTLASFKNPMSVAIDGLGNLWVADRLNYLVRKIATNGAVSTIAGTGSAGSADNNAGTLAGFDPPNGIAVDPVSGDVFVADANNHKIRKISQSGAVSTFAGSMSPGFIDGTGSVVRFNRPYSLSFDNQGNILAADTYNHSIRKLIRKAFTITPQLPAGLTFNETTGVISGTPTMPSPPTVYTITAYNQVNTGSTSLTLSVTAAGALSPSDENYVITYEPLADDINDMVQLSAAANDKDHVKTTIQYFDGLGRQVQTVQVKATPNGDKDLVVPFEYDTYGRELKKYLMYAASGSAASFRLNAISDQQIFYNPNPIPNPLPTQQANGIIRTVAPYSLSLVESSPLNRVTEQGAPGLAWQPGQRTATGGRTVITEYLTNNQSAFSNANGSQKAVWYRVDASGSLTAGVSELETYASNQLYVTRTKDENWETTDGCFGTNEEFKDKEGRVVLKRAYNKLTSSTGEMLSTYYVYDDLGNLTYVLPPGCKPDVALPTVDALNNFGYQYKYDVRNRLIEKKLPGKGWEYIIYNKLDQVVLTQDANQRSKATQQASFIKYDILGRKIMTGVFNVPGNPAPGVNHRVQMQDLVDSQVQQWESRLYAGSAGTTDYSTTCVPTSNFTPLMVNYYDDYANIPDKQTFFIPSSSSYSNRTIGLLTATRIAILNNPTQIMKNFIYYDKRGRETITFKQHYKGGSSNYTVRNHDAYYTAYSFNNRITTLQREHYANDGTTVPKLVLTILKEFEYDHMGRKTLGSQKIVNDGQDEATIAKTIVSKQSYNDLGQLLTKSLHSTDQGASFLQDINYTYNERGWLKTAISSNNKLNFTLNYNDPFTGIAPAYNGNITQMLYSAQYSSSQDLRYSYDKLNRIKSSTSADGLLNESLTYDNVGNIQTLTRGGQNYTTLNYTYLNNGQSNLLQTVSGSGFVTRNYQYDSNGNATGDGGQQTINYNVLNLPQTVSQGTTTKATYSYDASGMKVRSAQTGDTRDYINGIVYNGNAIEFIETEEGRAIPTAAAGTYNYTYDLKDHLGNARVTVAKNTSGSVEVLQEDEYYAFGLRKVRFDASNSNRYLYNGKELQSDLANQYDYGARFYDPVIGRFAGIDPLAEYMRKWSPYTYGFDNPVRFIDKDGFIPIPVQRFFNNLSHHISSWFGKRNTGLAYASTYHKGLDINFGSGSQDFGAPVMATHDGTVAIKDNTDGNSGRMVTVTSPDGKFRTRYMHLSKITVKEGQEVNEKDNIGEIGGSGGGKEKGRQVHLHYQIEKLNPKTGKFEAYNPTEGKSNSESNVVDPQTWINANGQSNEEESSSDSTEPSLLERLYPQNIPLGKELKEAIERATGRPINPGPAIPHIDPNKPYL